MCVFWFPHVGRLSLSQFRKENGQFFLSCCWCGCDGQFAHAPTTLHRRKLLLENNGGASTTDAASRCSRSLHLSRFRLWKRQTEIDSSFLFNRGKKSGTTTMETTEDVEKRFERAMERLFPGSPPTLSARWLFVTFHSYYYSAFWFRGLSQFLLRSKALVHLIDVSISLSFAFGFRISNPYHCICLLSFPSLQGFLGVRVSLPFVQCSCLLSSFETFFSLI